MIGSLRHSIREYLRYWSWAFQNVRSRIDGHWPIFGSMLIYALLSAAALYGVESPRGSPINTYWEALFTTWITMTTVGYGNLVPITVAGQLIVMIDAIVGLLLIGMIVWFVTGSLQGSTGPTDPPGDEGEDRPDERHAHLRE